MVDQTPLLQRILQIAQRDGNVRAAWLNGSRANPAAKPDRFSDYDVVFAVRDFSPFIRSRDWIARLGRLAIMQEPDNAPGQPPQTDRYAFLMQFEDGSRVDLTLASLGYAPAFCRAERAAVLLLDKDALLPPFTPADGHGYDETKPAQEQFWACANEFWWVCPYVVKGILRGQPTYALEHMNACVRPMLLQLLGWYAGVQNGWQVSAGKCGSNLALLLPDAIWQDYLNTYSDARLDRIGAALAAACALFDRVAPLTAELLGYHYRADEAEGSKCVMRTFARLE